MRKTKKIIGTLEYRVESLTTQVNDLRYQLEQQTRILSRIQAHVEYRVRKVDDVFEAAVIERGWRYGRTIQRTRETYHGATKASAVRKLKYANTPRTSPLFVELPEES